VPCLEQNCALNTRLAVRLSVHRLALSNRREERTIYRGPEANTGLTSLVEAQRENGLQFKIECCLADSVVTSGAAPLPALMKVDVEGWEEYVLLGASSILENKTLRALVIEAVSDDQGTMMDSGVRDLLTMHGFELHRIERPDRVIDSRENYIAVRRSD
jgi:FkbM family methyltransferase